MKAKVLIAFFMSILIISCTPLRHVRRKTRTDSTAVDRSEIRKIVTDLVKEQGTLLQTVVEFYPPATVVPATDSGLSAPYPSGAEGVAPATPATTAPAIRRIIKTQIAIGREQATTTDSTVHNDITTHVTTDTQDKTVDKPPAATVTVKWIALSVFALLIIILVIKLPRIRS